MVQQILLNEAIYVRYLHDGLPVNHLVSVTELSHAHADGVTDCIQSSMSKFGLDDWKQKLVGFYADGANVNMGQKAGVVANLESGQSKTDRHSLYGSQAGAGRSPVLVLKAVSLVSCVQPEFRKCWDGF